MQKKTFLLIVLTMGLLLLIPYIIFYGLYAIKLILFPFTVLFYFFEYVYLSFFISIIASICTFLFLKKKIKSVVLKILLPIFIAFSISAIGGLLEAEMYIKNKSIEKFEKEPIYLNICLKNALQFCPFRCDDICYYPHALVEKNGKYYYWSFQKGDFIILPESILSDWEIKNHNKGEETSNSP